MTARIGAYLIAVTAACMLAVMADALVKSPPVRRVARLVGGLLILLTVLSPLVRLEARDLTEFVEGFAQDANLDAEAVQTDYREQWAERVRELSPRTRPAQQFPAPALRSPQCRRWSSAAV